MKLQFWFMMLLATSGFAKEKGGKPVEDKSEKKDIRFEGKIEKIHFGIDYDGSNKITIDGKVIIFDRNPPNTLKDQLPTPPEGSMIGFDFSNRKTTEPADYNGRTAEVFCETHYSFGPKDQKIPSYSLTGKRDYYVKLK